MDASLIQIQVSQKPVIRIWASPILVSMRRVIRTEGRSLYSRDQICLLFPPSVKLHHSIPTFKDQFSVQFYLSYQQS